MPHRNVDIVRGVYQALGRGDLRSTLDIYDPHVVFVQRDETNIWAREIGGAYWGVDGLKDYMRTFLELWADVSFEADEFIEAGDTVVVGFLMRMVGRGSRAPVEGRYFHVWTFRGGLVIRLDALPTRQDALAAAGLPT